MWCATWQHDAVDNMCELHTLCLRPCTPPGHALRLAPAVPVSCVVQSVVIFDHLIQWEARVGEHIANASSSSIAFAMIHGSGVKCPATATVKNYPETITLIFACCTSSCLQNGQHIREPWSCTCPYTAIADSPPLFPTSTCSPGTG